MNDEIAKFSDFLTGMPIMVNSKNVTRVEPSLFGGTYIGFIGNDLVRVRESFCEVMERVFGEKV